MSDKVYGNLKTDEIPSLDAFVGGSREKSSLSKTPGLVIAASMEQALLYVQDERSMTSDRSGD